MKFTVQMKDPDTLDDAIADAVKDDLATVVGLDDDDRANLAESREEKAREVAARWFEYGEYLAVEIDTEAKTCVVLPAKS